MSQQVAEADAAARQTADLEATRLAAAQQLGLAQERETLSDQADAEARRQARLAGVAVDVNIQQVTGAEALDRRRRFFGDYDL